MNLSAIFSDNMVFAANKPARIFGEGVGEVKIEFLGNEYFGYGHLGKCEVALPECDYGGPYEIAVTMGDEVRVLKNIYFGEVILCAGQSNIEWRVMSESDPGELTDLPLLRIWMPETTNSYSALGCKNGWQICTAENTPHFTALGYHLAKEISEKKGCAVGIIGCYHGATMLSSFLRRELAVRADIYVPDEQKFRDKIEYPTFNYEGKMHEVCFSKIAPFAVSAVVWYQGETNTASAEAKIYGRQLEVLIHSWREELRDYALPFAIVQIHDYTPRLSEEWKRVQSEQARVALRVPNASLVVSRDICETTEIHPKNKTLLAKRAYTAIYG
jgi:sialate O-acetylesterase